MKTGQRVIVALPADIHSWHSPVSVWLAHVVFVNGDMLDVENSEGQVEPVDSGWVHPIPSVDTDVLLRSRRDPRAHEHWRVRGDTLKRVK